MNPYLTFAFIGGDLRQVQVITRFAREGHAVRIYGLDDAVFPEDITVEKNLSLKNCLDSADIVVLPLPYSTGGETIRSSFCAEEIYFSDVLRQMTGTQLLFVGRADAQILALSKLYNIHLVDYGVREELAVLNSIPTVEGALSIAMAETPFTIHQSHSLVLGYGRIGKILADALHALGANVTVAARKHSDLAWISARGLTGIPFTRLSDVIGSSQLVFNTVPSLVLDFRMLSLLSDSACIIDLASRPGGVDFETAKALNKKVIWALSLPGKAAPETAGDIIKDTISNILQELGV